MTPGDGDESEETREDGDLDHEQDPDKDLDADDEAERVDGDSDDETGEEVEWEQPEGEWAEEDGDLEQEERDIFAGGCNGHAALCERRFDQVAYATTHNAMSNRADGWVAPNQNHGLRRQLEDGIRGMMLDSYLNEDEPYLCHGDCFFGKILMKDALEIIRVFLDEHPAEVVALIFEDYLGFEKTAAVFAESGLGAYVYRHEADRGWPTLRGMIESGQRVVVFSDRGAGEEGWYLDLFDHCFETHWSNKAPEDFRCASNRGDPSHDLFILNHFLSNPLPTAALAEQVNHNPFFWERARQCRDHYERIINFPTVDFHDIGDVLAVTQALNGLDTGAATTP